MHQRPAASSRFAPPSQTMKKRPRASRTVEPIVVFEPSRDNRNHHAQQRPTEAGTPEIRQASRLVAQPRTGPY